MTCQILKPEEQAQAYVAGLLPESAAEAFEVHFFSCVSCLGAVRDAEALRDALAELRTEPARTARRWLPLAAAAALVVASVVTLKPPSRPEATPGGTEAAAQAPADAYAALARFEPPPPPSARLRGPQTTDLERGLERYRQADFPGAVRALRAAASKAPDPAASFFLGVSLLLVGETDEALTALNTVVAGGDSPYLEEAHLYLARGHFARGDFRAAERDLELSIALKGDRSEEARALLSESRSRRPAPPR